VPTSTVVLPSSASFSEGSPFLPRTQLPEPFCLVMFGANGDLAARKLMPGLLSLWKASLLPEQFAIIGLGRREKRDEDFRSEFRNAIQTFRNDLLEPVGAPDNFFAKLYYAKADATRAQDMDSLGRRVKEVEKLEKLPGNRLFYLATWPPTRNSSDPSWKDWRRPAWFTATANTRGAGWSLRSHLATI